jgi:DNA-directed RNA polymerase subunit beta
MPENLKNHYLERVNFSKIKATFPMPDMLEIQKKSYAEYLQMELLPEERKDLGLQAAFKDIYPVSDFKETTQLDFISYSIGNWECKCGRLKGVENSRHTCKSCGTLLSPDEELTEKQICPYCGAKNKIDVPVCVHCGDNVNLKMKYSPNECLQKGYTYSVPLRIKVRLISWEKDPVTKAKRLKHIKEQEVYFGDIPLMTDKGTFIFNGIERVVVSQLQRSPGVFYRPGDGKGFFIGKIIPYRGAWVEFEYDSKGILFVRLDRKKKFLATVFLRALGFGSNEEIIKLFYKTYKIVPKKGNFYWELSENLIGKTVDKDILRSSSKEVLAKGRKKINQETFEKLKQSKIKQVSLAGNEFEGAFSVQAVEELIAANEEISEEHLEELSKRGESFEVFFPEMDSSGEIISKTLKKDTSENTDQALGDIYKKLRPGEPHTMESAHNLFRNLFFNPQKYNFSKIGRLKMNIKLGLDIPLEEKTLSPIDFVGVIQYLLNLRNGEGTVDDIDHLGNRWKER